MHQVTTPFLASLEGSEIPADADTYFSLPAQTWIMTQHLEESALLMSQKEVECHGWLICYLLPPTESRLATLI